ncbi:type VI protein secretion system component VasF [Ensifer mexicanus]|nr:type VI protein secretion system component VasF [Sinorhizobium mexicanum]
MSYDWSGERARRTRMLRISGWVLIAAAIVAVVAALSI